MVNEDRRSDRNRRIRWLLRAEFSRFADEVLRTEWAILSVHSCVSDFDSCMPREELARRIEQTFGIRQIEVLVDPARPLIEILALVPTARPPLATVVEEELDFRGLLPFDAASRAQLIRLVTAVAVNCRAVHDLAYRLRSTYESSTERSQRTDFANWRWLAEDLLARVHGTLS